MAGDLGRLLVRYGVDTSELSTAEAKLNTTFGRIKDAAISGAGMIAGAAGLGGVVWTTKNVVENFASFDDAMQKVKVVSGATGEEFSKLAQLARDMATKTEFSAAQIAQGMYELSSAGMDAAQQLKIMPAVLDLATAGGIEMSQAAELVVKSLAGFNLEASEAGHVTDVMASAVNSSMLHFEDLTLAMKYIAPVAGATGQSIEDLTAALAIMSNQGIRGEQAGTTLRAAFVRLMDPPREAAEGLAKLGLTVDQINPATHDLSEIVATLAERSRGLDEATRNQALSMVFGTEALSGMLAIINAGPDALRNLSSAFRASEGTAKKSAEEMRESFSRQWEMLKNKFMDVAMEMAKVLVPVVDGVMKFIDAIGGARNALILLGSVWVGLKVASWGGAFASLGAQAAAATAGTQLAFEGMGTAAGASFAGGLKAALTASLGEVGVAASLGLGAAAGGIGYAIGNAIGNALMEGANVGEAVAAYEQAAQAVYAGVEETMGAVKDFGATHRAEIVNAGKDLVALSREYMAMGFDAEQAKDMAVAAVLDQKLAIQGLQAQLRNLYQLQIDTGGAMDTAPIEALRRKIIELKATTGEIAESTRAALAKLQAIPTDAIEVLQSGNQAARDAGVQAVAEYAAGLASMAGMTEEQAASVASLTAEAFASKDAAVKQAAYNTILQLVEGLKASGVLPVTTAEQIKSQLVAALGLTQAQIQGIKFSYDSALGQIGVSFSSGAGAQAIAEAQRFANTMERLLKLESSPAVDVKIPAVYAKMFDNLEGVFATRAPAIGFSLAGLSMPSPAGGGGAAVQHHWHIGTLIADERSMLELARKFRFNYLPRVSRGL